MDFKDYQAEASKTIQHYMVGKELNQVVPFLGIIGEAGSVISELKKKLRDGTSYTNYKNKLKEELGDVLWYISAIATQNDINLEDIAAENVKKIKDRFELEQTDRFRIYDESYPEEERFPREFEVNFSAVAVDGKEKMRITNNTSGKQLGGDLTDNSHQNDGYRF